MAEMILLALLKVNLAGAAAILLMLALRAPARRALGARAAYRMWLVVPVAALAVLLPARAAAPAAIPIVAGAVEEALQTSTPAIPVEFGAMVAPAPVVTAPPPMERAVPPLALIAVWLLGAVALLARALIATRRIARDPALGPALAGLLRPRLILPADFETRYDARERTLILAHEDAHRAGGHTALNALAEAARCACWFNPLAHVGLGAFRADQELACDATVMVAHPAERGAYARALLKSQIAPAAVPLGCAWPSRSAERLKDRIEMLGLAAPGRARVLAGAAAMIAIGAMSGVAAWAAQPARIAAPEPVWTPSADAPMSVADPARHMLTELEAQRHDRFIELARTASSCSFASDDVRCTPGTGIDIVFFGTTNTEMFWWPERGLDVWRDALGQRNAVNFGSQGTRPESLLWRMRNGELDGYQAKLIVLSPLTVSGDIAIPEAGRVGLLADYAAIVSEIRVRQPQAKILILADFPRGFAQYAEEWREIAAANAAVYAPLVDNETVFYADIGERFYRPDGAHDPMMWARWGQPAVSVGMQPRGFEVWAEELDLWLDRFAR